MTLWACTLKPTQCIALKCIIHAIHVGCLLYPSVQLVIGFHSLATKRFTAYLNLHNTMIFVWLFVYPGCDILIRWVFIKNRQTLLSLLYQCTTPVHPVFGGVRVVHLLLFLCTFMYILVRFLTDPFDFHNTSFVVNKSNIFTTRRGTI